MSTSEVERNLRAQRRAWPEVATRTLGASRAALLKRRPKRYVFTGLGSSHHAARICGHFLELEGEIRALSSVEALVIEARADDCLVAFSHRGGGGPTREALKKWRERGALTIRVAGQGAAPDANAELELSTVPLETVEPHTISLTSALCAASVFFRREVKDWEGGADPNLQALRVEAGLGPTILLGENVAEWLAREAALKLMEMAALPVRPYGSEEFFHGPRMSHSAEKDVIWHVVGSNDPRRAVIEARYLPTVSVSAEGFQGVIEALVRLQWLALAVAFNRGVNPDRPDWRA